MFTRISRKTEDDELQTQTMKAPSVGVWNKVVWSVTKLHGKFVIDINRDMIFKILLPVLILVLIVSIASGTVSACEDSFIVEYSKAGWPVPDLIGYQQLAIARKIDLEDTNIEFTVWEIFYQNSHTRFYEVFYKDGEGYVVKYINPPDHFGLNTVVWAWAKFDAGDETLGFVIVDSDGDGIFEEKYRVNAKFYMPEWVNGLHR